MAGKTMVERVAEAMASGDNGGAYDLAHVCGGREGRHRSHATAYGGDAGGRAMYPPAMDADD